MKNEKKERNIGKYKKVALLVTYDILAVVLAEFLSIWARFEFTLTLPDSARDYLAPAWNSLPRSLLRVFWRQVHRALACTCFFGVCRALIISCISFFC